MGLTLCGRRRCIRALQTIMRLGYWKIRGLAGPIRLLITYTGEELEEDIYEQGEESEGYSREQWYSVKETLNLDFPNLPYFFDGDFKLTQSMAILRYVARKHNLLGKTAEEMAKVDMVLDEGQDLYKRFTPMCYNANFENLKADFLLQLPPRLKRFEDFIGNGCWFVGGITAADFYMWHVLEAITLLEPQCLGSYPKLSSFLKKFEALP